MGDSNLLVIHFGDLTDLKQVGKGANGEVYRASHKLLGSELAVKVFKVDNEGEMEALMEELRNEIELLSLMRHPNIVQCFGCCLEPPNLAIVMEFCPKSVYGVLHSKDFKMDLPRLLSWSKDIVSGMMYLHDVKKSIHRDMKTGNLLVTRNDTIKITDFGVSRLKENATAQPMTMIGTIEYMAPEISQGTYSFPVDIYGFGVVLWEMATQQRPYHDANVPRIALIYRQFQGLRPGGSFKEDGSFEWTHPLPDWCPPELSELVLATWLKDPDERPSFSQIWDTLQKLSGENVPAPLKMDIHQTIHPNAITTAGRSLSPGVPGQSPGAGAASSSSSPFLGGSGSATGMSSTGITTKLQDAAPELMELLPKWWTLDVYVHMREHEEEDEEEEEEEEEEDEEDEEEEEEEVEEVMRKIRLHDKLCFESLKRTILEKFRITEDSHQVDTFEMKYVDAKGVELELGDNDDLGDAINSCQGKELHLYCSITTWAEEDSDEGE